MPSKKKKWSSTFDKRERQQEKSKESDESSKTREEGQAKSSPWTESPQASQLSRGACGSSADQIPDDKTTQDKQDHRGRYGRKHPDGRRNKRQRRHQGRENASVDTEAITESGQTAAQEKTTPQAARSAPQKASGSSVDNGPVQRKTRDDNVDKHSKQVHEESSREHGKGPVMASPFEEGKLPDADFYEEDGNCGFEKRGTPWMTAEVADADNTDVSVTQGCQQKRVTQSSVSNTEVGVTPGYHAKRITQSSISKKKKPKKNSTLKRLNRSKSFDRGSLANTVATDEVTGTKENPNKHYVELDAAIRKEITDWCGGETFLTEESLPRSGMVTERDNGMKNKAVHKKGERNNHVTNSNNDDDDDDFANWCNKKSSELRRKRVLIHERDEESGCEENNNSFDCIKKSTKFRNKCVLSDSEESDGGKNHRTHNNKKHSSKVTYKRVRTYDSDEVSDGDI